MLILRSATSSDVPLILRLIRELAEYEREPESVLATEADLLRDGFPSPHSNDRPAFGCLIADWDNVGVGFALYFYNYSTWRGHTGIHLEDLFVTPAMRGKGIGKALITRVAAIAVEEGCPRFQWDVLEWNTPAIGFYKKLGAEMQTEWRIMRVTGEALRKLATQPADEASAVILSEEKNPRISRQPAR